MLEAHELAGRRDIDAVLLFLERAEPAVAPAPQPHAGSHDAVGAFQARFPLEERLCLIVEIESRGLPVAADGVISFPEEARGQRLRVAAIYAEIDRRLGKRAIEIPHGEPGRNAQQGQAHGDETVVRRAQPVSHDYPLVAQCNPIASSRKLRWLTRW